jgi:elongation factor P
MKINGNEVKPGMILEHQGKLWRVARISHTQPGKGGAYTQAEMKCITDGTKLNERFRSDEKVERARLEQRPMQYLYDDGNGLTFMDTTTYDQISLPYELLGEQRPWLQENMNTTIELYEGTPIGVELPTTVELNVVEADAVVKGQTASSSYKPAKLENGQDVLVPPYVEAGMRVAINTADGSFSGRA